MADVAWEDYLIEVRPKAKGCPEGIAVNAIRNAAIEFCDETLVWRETLDPLNIVIGTPDYSLDVPNDGEVILIRWAKYNGTTIGSTSEDDLDQGRGQYAIENWRDTDGEPLVFFAPDPDIIYLVPNPSVAVTNGLTMGVALKPKIDSYEGPEKLYNQWREAIAAGAVGKLLDMKSRSWYAPAEAAKATRDFNRGKVKARIKAGKSNTMYSQQTQMRPLA